MKKQKLEPIHTITKSEASYQKLMLQMMSTLIAETKQNNALLREHIARPKIVVREQQKKEVEREREMDDDSFRSPQKSENNDGDNRWDNRRGGKGGQNARSGQELQSNTHQSHARGSPQIRRVPSQPNFQKQSRQSKLMQRLVQQLTKRLDASEQTNKRLLNRLQSIQTQSRRPISSPKKQIKPEDLSIIQKAITNVPNPKQDQKKSYVILSEILPHSDRREMKVKFKISDIMSKDVGLITNEMTIETSEWLGQVYRATASICWNMLLNNYLTFDEVKILFTENIVYNFIEFMNELTNMGRRNQKEKLTALINEKSVEVLDFLCKQYPQTKIQAPNMALRSILPQIDNQARVKFDLVGLSGIEITYNPEGDYTSQIMRMINFMIDKTNKEYDYYENFMRNTFEEVFVPIHRRRKMDELQENATKRQLTHEDLVYKDKVKTFTKYLIGRKISKNTAKYTEEEISDGIFFVKSSGVLRIITKWVEQLMEYFIKPEEKIKNSYGEMKDHSGKVMYVSSLLKDGLYQQILNEKKNLMKRIQQIKGECYKMEMLLTNQQFVSDNDQVHLSEEQISVGLYCSNLKSAISSYICSQLNELIHSLLKIPRNVKEDDLGCDLQDFKSQARKDLDSINMVTFKIFDLLRCKIHSNEDEILWIIQYLLTQNKINKNDKFRIVRIKDRLHLGTRDIMINARINKGLTCEIQLAVTSTSDKKQELLDQYNHFLYELKRSKLGPITENVSIWSTLQQRFSYFQQLLKDKRKGEKKFLQTNLKHKCGKDHFKIFKRPVICNTCLRFFSIPKTCLLNVVCQKCNESICGQCYYYSYLNEEQHKEYIFQRHRLFKPQILSKLHEYTDPSKPLPATAFFVNKKFLKKELQFFMAIEKNKNEKIKQAENVQILLTQTIIRNGQLLNRQINKGEAIFARLVNGQFIIKDYNKTLLNNLIIFYFEKTETKKFLTLKDIETELHKPEFQKARILNLVIEPAYISELKPIKKESQKLRLMHHLGEIINDAKITVYVFPHIFVLTQVCVKGTELRNYIAKKINISALKGFAEKESNIVSMQFRRMTTEMEEIKTKMNPSLYQKFCNNLTKLFLAGGEITSVKCMEQYPKLTFLDISDNNIKSLEGIGKLEKLISFRFDANYIETLEELTNITNLKYIFGNQNCVKSLKGLQNCKRMKYLSMYQNSLENIDEIKGLAELQELYLRDNPIQDLSLISTLKGLKKLFIGKTKIKTIPDLSKLPNLISLSLENLQLTTIPPILKQTHLRELFLSFNSISKIQNLENQNQLVLLNIGHNQIQKIENLGTLDKLQVLKLRNNKISVISGLREIESLRLLNLKCNPIDDIQELSRFQVHFAYEFTLETFSQKAKKQLHQFETVRTTTSSGED